MKYFQSNTIYLAVVNSPASLASASKSVTNLMIYEIVRKSPLNRRIGSCLERYMCEPDQLCDLILFKYLTFLWATITMPLAWYIMTPSGYVEN